MKAIDMVMQDKFAEFLGIKVVECCNGRSKVSLQCDERFFNGIGRIQGGAFYTLADFAFALASNSSADKMENAACAVGISTTITFLKAGQAGQFFAEAKEVSVNKTIGHYDVVITGENGDIYAIFNGVAYFKKGIK